MLLFAFFVQNEMAAAWQIGRQLTAAGTAIIRLGENSWNRGYAQLRL